MHSTVALDFDVVRLLVSALNWQRAAEPDAESIAALRIYLYLTSPMITPTIASEIEQAAEPGLANWRNYQLEEVSHSDDFFRGCVKGMADRYLDYHPDPRDCRVVAEAECAKAKTFLSVNPELVRGLSGRSEAINVLSPSKYWRRAHVAHGAPTRVQPAAGSPLTDAGWWRW